MKVVVKSMLFLCCLVINVACSGSKEESKNNSMIVNAVKVQIEETDSHKEFPFIAKPFRTSELSFRVGGPIHSFDVYVGNYYKRGDVIAEIDSRDFKIRKERAQAIYNQSKAEFERIEILYKKDNISASIYEKAKSDYIASKMAYETATNELADTQLVAPFNGYIGDIYIEKYQDVKATQPVIAFVDIEQLRVEAYVTQDIAFNSQLLESVNLYFDADPHNIYIAKVAEISKSTTKNNLSYLLTALVPNKNAELLSGMSGKVAFDIIKQSSHNTITIPQSALCHRPTVGSYVWVINSDSQQVERRLVKPGGMQSNGKISIAEGVVEGDVIATSGLRFLSEGMVVEIADKSNL